MSYELVEAALKTILLYDTTTFPTATTQVTRGDWRGMDLGMDLIAVLYAGPFSQSQGEDTAASEFQTTWIAKLDLIKRYSTDGTTRTTFAQKRDAVLEQIMKYPMLHGLASVTAKLGLITSDGDPLPVFDKDGNGPFFLMQTFSIPVSEILAITPQG